MHRRVVPILGLTIWILGSVTVPTVAELPLDKPVTGGPYKVIAADFAGDKLIDLALTHSPLGVATVQRGDGTFKPAITTPNGVIRQIGKRVRERSSDSSTAKPLSIEQARVAVTGHDVNRPDPFPGIGKFGWPGNIQQLPGGELILVHSAGYWHSSFAQPRLIEPKLRKRWAAGGWPLDFSAPSGGRSMITRSTDGGKTWTKPKTIIDLKWDDGATGFLRCKDGTLLCFINVQSSWYGFDKAPEQFRNDLDGLNSSQCLVRSTDNGKTWSKPIWLESPGKFYQRSHAQAIQLPDGGVLWPTYCMDSRQGREFAVIHRSDDSGKTWRTISTVRRKDKIVDEPCIGRLDDGRLIMVCRPDGGVFFSNDDGVTWKESNPLVKEGYVKAPILFVLKDGTVVCVVSLNGLRVVLSRDRGRSWSHPIPLDASSYGYPGGMRLKDDSLLVSYTSSSRAPNRIYVVRFQVNPNRDGITLLPID
jgi:hypothetical protein